MLVLPEILLGLFFVSLLAAVVCGFLALPRFKALERRGVIRRPVPGMLFARGGGFRSFELMWLTAIPKDRPVLRRIVFSYRAANLAGLFSAIALAVTIGKGFDPRPIDVSGVRHGFTVQVQEH